MNVIVYTIIAFVALKLGLGMLMLAFAVSPWFGGALLLLVIVGLVAPSIIERIHYGG